MVNLALRKPQTAAILWRKGGKYDFVPSSPAVLQTYSGENRGCIGQECSRLGHLSNGKEQTDVGRTDNRDFFRIGSLLVFPVHEDGCGSEGRAHMMVHVIYS